MEDDSRKAFSPLLASAVVFCGEDIFIREVHIGSRLTWVLPGDLAKAEYRPSVVLHEHLYTVVGWTFTNEWIHFTGGIIVPNNPESPNYFGRDFIINYYWLDFSDITDFEPPSHWRRVPIKQAVDRDCKTIYENDREAIIESVRLRSEYRKRDRSDRFIS